LEGATEAEGCTVWGVAARAVCGSAGGGGPMPPLAPATGGLAALWRSRLR
jgi:hypothetical protein